MKAVSEFLATNGVRYAVESLKVLRRVAAAFPSNRRGPFSWTIHQEARTPDRLHAIVARLPRGQILSVDYVKQEIRRMTGAVPNQVKRPRGVAALMARLLNYFKSRDKAERVSTVVALMVGLGVELTDLSAARLATSPVVHKPAAVRAVA